MKHREGSFMVLQLSQTISVVCHWTVDHYTNSDKKMRKLRMNEPLVFKKCRAPLLPPALCLLRRLVGYLLLCN